VGPANTTAKTAILASYAVMLAAGSAATAETSACAKNRIIIKSSISRNRCYFQRIIAKKAYDKGENKQ
jgi:hypothetical protein